MYAATNTAWRLDVKLTWEGGCRTDEGPVSTQEFILYSENVRWRNGRPETLGVYTQLLDDNDDPIELPLTPGVETSIFNDREVAVIGHGTNLWTYRYDTRDLAALPAVDPGPSGRWWFTTTEAFIYCARSNLQGRVHVIDRATLGIQILRNSPVGALCGGIVDGVLVLGGTTGYLEEIGGENPPPKELVVRWSARRNDPKSLDGDNYGFEDWVSTDINSAGENLLDEGQSIVGGGSTQFGFAVWTDSTMYMESPRSDQLVFDQNRVSDVGLYASGAWTVLENTVHWLDNARSWNVYDGGPARRLKNPMTSASTEIIGEPLSAVHMVRNTRYGEVMLLYTSSDNQRQLVVNQDEKAWYAFRQDWASYAERKGLAPALSISPTGGLFSHSLRNAATLDYVYPPNVPVPQTYLVSTRVVTPEPIPFFITSNYLVVDEPLKDGPRTWNVILSHNYGTDPDSSVDPRTDQISIQIDTFDKAARNGKLVTTDTQSMNLGEEGRDFRGGGKAMTVTIFGTIQSFVRFGDIYIDHIKGARR